MADKNMKVTLILFIISWLAVAASAFLYAGARGQNTRLQGMLTLNEAKARALAQQVTDYRKLRAQKSAWDNSALNYVEWQYALKEQINIARLRLLNEIRQIPDIRKDRDMSNLLYYNLGLACTMAVDFKSAITAFHSALDVKATDADSCYDLGLLYSATAQPRQAVEYYERFLYLSPKSPKANEVEARIKELGKK